MRSSQAGRGCPGGGVAMYTWRPVRWGASVSHWHLFAASRWRRASRVPSVTASQPTRSPSQPSSSWRSASARSVGSMRSKGPWVSPSRDRASSYTGPPVLKCATASWAAPSSGGCHRTVDVLCPHLPISVKSPPPLPPPPTSPPPTFGSLRSTDGSLCSTRGPAPHPP